MTDGSKWTAKRIIDEMPQDDEAEKTLSALLNSIVPQLWSVHPIVVGGVLARLVTIWLMRLQSKEAREKTLRNWWALLNSLIEEEDEHD